MNMTKYQRCAAAHAIYPKLGHEIVYPALGLAGEAGEVAEKVKKLMRDGGGTLTLTRGEEIAKELGDCLWYISECARQAGYTLTEIAVMNLDKLSSREKRGVIQGEGDNR